MFKSVGCFEKDPDDRIFLLLGDFSCCPNFDKDVVNALDKKGLVDILEFRREDIWPNGFLIRHALNLFRHLADGWPILNRQFKRSRRQETNYLGIEFQRFRVQGDVSEESFTNSHLVPQQRDILFPTDLLAPRSCPFQSHRTLQVPMYSSLIVSH